MHNSYAILKLATVNHGGRADDIKEGIYDLLKLEQREREREIDQKRDQIHHSEATLQSSFTTTVRYVIVSERYLKNVWSG